jgi:hypothetical protein
MVNFQNEKVNFYWQFFAQLPSADSNVIVQDNHGS